MKPDMTPRLFAVLIALISLGLVARPAQATPMYTVTDLRLPSGNGYLYPKGINSSGDVIGQVGTTPYLYSGGQFTDVSSTGANGLAINDSGQMTKGNDFAINNAGQTLGFSSGPSPRNTVDGVAVDGGFWAINNAGVAVGEATLSNGHNSGYAVPIVYSNGKTTQLPLLPGATGAAAYAINDRGQIVGGAMEGNSHPFLLDGNRLLDLGGSWGCALGINNSSQVVGLANIDGSGQRPFLFQDGKMLDLNGLLLPGSKWTLDSAVGINDAGQIIGIGHHDGIYSGVLLTPISTPEPGTLLIMALGIAMFYTGAARRRSQS